MEPELNPCRKTLLRRLAAIIFFAELAHGMLLYGIIPDLVQRFPASGLKLFGVLPVKLEIAAFCIAAYTLAELCLKVAAGHWVDRRGPDVPLRLGLLLSLVTVPVILLSKNPDVMLLGSFAHGMGAAPIWPAVLSAWTRGSTSEERGKIMGEILTGWMAGLGSGIIAGKFLVALTGRAELIATCAPIGLWGITIASALWANQSLGVPAGHGMDEEEQARLQRGFPPELKVMAIGLFIQNLAFGSLILPFNFLAEQHYLLNPAQVGLVFLLGGGPAVLLLKPMGDRADRMGKRNAVMGSMFLVSPLIIVAPFVSYLPVDPWVRLLLMVPGLVIAGVAYAFLLPAWHGLALGRIPEHQRGRSLALLMSVEMAALAGGQAMGTPIYTKVSFAAPFVGAGLVFALLAGIYMAGYILPPETPGEPHLVDLSSPHSSGGPDGANGAGLGKPKPPLDQPSNPSPRSAG